jgi:hypothetical protein
VPDDGVLAPVRLAELVATLSLAADLGLGQPMEHCLRQTIMALRLADRVGVDESELVATYYTGLLRHVYCHADAHEQAKWFGDDIALKAYGFESGADSIMGVLRMVGSGTRGLARAGRVASFPVSGIKEVRRFCSPTRRWRRSSPAGSVSTRSRVTRSGPATSAGTARASRAG